MWVLSICTTTLNTYNMDVINGCLFIQIFIIDKNKYDEYIMTCVLCALSCLVVKYCQLGCQETY